jgi:hypothetical protein
MLINQVEVAIDYLSIAFPPVEKSFTVWRPQNRDVLACARADHPGPVY